MGNVQNVVHPGTDDLALSLDRHSGPSSSSRPNHGAEHTLFGPERKKILFHGLDGAGKTSLIYQFRCMVPGTTISPSTLKTGRPPRTSSVSLREFSIGSETFTVIDVPGHAKYTSLRFDPRILQAPNIVGCLFLVDATDPLRLPLVAKELLKLLSMTTASSSHNLLLVATKQDKPEAMSTEQMREELNGFFRLYHDDRKIQNQGRGEANPHDQDHQWVIPCKDHQMTTPRQTSSCPLARPPALPAFQLMKGDIISPGPFGKIVAWVESKLRT